jgi:hypothetical protein
VAHAAEGDIDLDVVGARRAAGDVDGLEGFIGGLGAIGFYSHGIFLSVSLQGGFGMPRPCMVRANACEKT